MHQLAHTSINKGISLAEYEHQLDKEKINFLFFHRQGKFCIFSYFYVISCLYPTGPMYFVFCRLYPSSPKPPRQCLDPTCNLFTLNLHCIAGAGLPIHMIGEVSWEPKRRRAWSSLPPAVPAAPIPSKPLCQRNILKPLILLVLRGSHSLQKLNCR